MNKTEDDELDAEELTDEELKQVAGHLRLLSLVAVDWLRVWAQGRHSISPPRLLAECCKRRISQDSFVLLCLFFLGCV